MVGGDPPPRSPPPHRPFAPQQRILPARRLAQPSIWRYWGSRCCEPFPFPQPHLPLRVLLIPRTFEKIPSVSHNLQQVTNRSNSHLSFQLPQGFITWLLKQGACFPSALIYFPSKMALTVPPPLLTPPLSTCIWGSPTPAPVLSRQPLPKNNILPGPGPHCCHRQLFLSFLHVPTLLWVPLLLRHSTCPGRIPAC